jgi:hypothetical protein
MTEEHEMEMALSRADFMRLLPQAVRGPYRVAEDAEGRIFGGLGGMGWDIQLTALPPRKIALLELPRLKVLLRLHSNDPVATGAWLHRFMLGYQRAGG